MKFRAPASPESPALVSLEPSLPTLDDAAVFLVIAALSLLVAVHNVGAVASWCGLAALRCSEPISNLINTTGMILVSQ